MSFELIVDGSSVGAFGGLFVMLRRRVRRLRRRPAIIRSSGDQQCGVGILEACVVVGAAFACRHVRFTSRIMISIGFQVRRSRRRF